MGHGHSHRRVDAGAAATESTPRTLLVAVLALIAVATVVAMIVLWPDGSVVDELQDNATQTAPGVTYPRGEVTGVSNDMVSVRLDDGTDVVLSAVPPQVVDAGLREGDSLWVMRTPGADRGQDAYSYWGVERQWPLGWLALGFLLVVVVVARLRGVRALAGLAVSGAVIAWFMLPALLSGQDGIVVALVGASAIMFTVLYLTHGINLRTSAALAGTLIGVLLTAGLASVSVRATRLTGVSEEGGQILQSQVPGLDFQGLLACAVILAGLGILNDVTITQASSAWELRAAAPHLSRLEVFQSTMRIGRDHIASTIYTMTFAYTGTALATLMLLLVYAQPPLQLLSAEELTQEIVHTLVSGIGLVLAVPATTMIAALTLAPGVDNHSHQR